MTLPALDPRSHFTTPPPSIMLLPLCVVLSVVTVQTSAMATPYRWGVQPSAAELERMKVLAMPPKVLAIPSQVLATPPPQVLADGSAMLQGKLSDFLGWESSG